MQDKEGNLIQDGDRFMYSFKLKTCKGMQIVERTIVFKEEFTSIYENIRDNEFTIIFKKLPHGTN